MEYSSDDDSVVSSGDEMLNIVVPFSQDSTKGKKSESDDDTSTASPSKKRKRVEENVGNLKDDNNDDDDDDTADDKNNETIAIANATTAFKIQFDQKLGATNKLFWSERRHKKNATLYPVRVVPREEVVGLSLKEWDTETERPVQYIQYPHKQIKRDLGLYDVVSVKSLTPYHGGDGPTDSWCSKRIQQYSKQLKRTLKGINEIDLLSEKAFLKLVLEQSLKEEESERERSLLAEAAPAESAASEKEDEQVENDSDDDDDDDDDINGSSGGRRSRLCRSDSVKREPLRVGDIIEYYKPTSVAGNPDALCQAEVKFINPKGSPILVTSDIFTILPSEHQIKRVKRMHRGKLLDHHNGSFRAINSYILQKEGNPNAVRDIMAETTSQTKATIQRAKDEISSRMDDGGFFPRDLLRN